MVYIYNRSYAILKLTEITADIFLHKTQSEKIKRNEQLLAVYDRYLSFDDRYLSFATVWGLRPFDD